MSKFTTEQLQQAMIDLYPKKDIDSCTAYAMTFEEVHKRMGDEAFDAWLEANGL